MGNFRIPFEPDTFYHIYNHGNGEENIYRCNDNYYYFLRKFAEHINPIAETFAYCLMPNHFHFLIRIRKEGELFDLIKNNEKPKNINDKMSGSASLSNFLSNRFKNFLIAYSKAFNKMYSRRGSLFLDNIKRKKIDSDAYFSSLVYYIHHNPVHHGFTNKIEDWPFSSYNSIVSNKQSYLNREETLKWFGDRSLYLDFHKKPFQDKKVLQELYIE